MAKQRDDAFCAKAIANVVENRSARVTEHKVESFEAIFADIRHLFASLEPIERHGGVEIVEHAQRAPCGKHVSRRRDPVGTERRHEGDIRFRNMGLGLCADVAPVRVENEFAAGELEKIAGSCVIGLIPFEEHDAPAPRRQRAL